MNHLFHPEAEDEFLDAIQYYSLIDSELGKRFYLEIERLVQEVCDTPQRFHRFDPPARRHFSRTFPYAIIFLEEPDHIWIVAVMHMKRRPGYWKDRTGTS